MNKKISKRRIKIINKKRHEILFNEISKKYSISKKVFGNGYFLFSFDENSISWFWLEEFPDWKFGIWLNENGYDIFGEAIIQIDKFKPTASTLSEKNVNKFMQELEKINNNDGLWGEYNTTTKKDILIKAKSDFISNKNIELLQKFIQIENDKYNNEEVDSGLELFDRNKGSKGLCFSPRYVIYELVDNDIYIEDFERTSLLFEKMSKIMTYIGNWENGEINHDKDYLDVDSIIFEHRELMNPQDFLDEEIRYERKEPITKFEDLVEKFKKELNK